MNPKLARLAKRTLVGGSLVVVVGLVLDAAWESEDGFVVWAIGALLAAGCVFEVTRMRRILPRSLVPAFVLGLLLSLVPGVLHYFGGGIADPEEWGMRSWLSGRGVVLAYLAGAVGATLGALLFARRLAVPARVLELSALVFAPLPALALVWQDFGPRGLLSILLLAKIGDVFGYYVGNAIGKRHPFPNVSPGKTTAGCVASLVAGTVAGGACAWFGLLPVEGRDLLPGFVAGALVNVAAQAGDLLESRWKRAAGIKDSGPWFGPSGGFLDLVDSLVLGVPVALLSWPWLLG